MQSDRAGTDTSPIEITNVSSHGVWIYIEGEEFFMPFTDFPWFRDATIRQIQKVTLIGKHHLHWEDLDVDLEVASLRNPEDYPLVYRSD